jgi:hypothetical protein
LTTACDCTQYVSSTIEIVCNAVAYSSMTGATIAALAFAAYATVQAWVLSSVNQAVPDDYMDEIFHGPQARRYCRGESSWDPKITTFPGIYLLGAAYGRANYALTRLLGHHVTLVRA